MANDSGGGVVDADGQVFDETSKADLRKTIEAQLAENYQNLSDCRPLRTVR